MLSLLCIQGITCVDLSPSNPKVTVTGGVDKDVIVFNHEDNQVWRGIPHSQQLQAPSFAIPGRFATDGLADDFAGDGKAQRPRQKSYGGEISPLTSHGQAFTYIALLPLRPRLFASKSRLTSAICR